MGAWAKKWQIKFNVDKGKVMYAGYQNTEFEHELNGKWLNDVCSENDLGVIINKDMKPHEQCIAARNKANNIIGITIGIQIINGIVFIHKSSILCDK